MGPEGILTQDPLKTSYASGYNTLLSQNEGELETINCNLNVLHPRRCIGDAVIFTRALSLYTWKNSKSFNSRRAASSLVRLVEGEERWEDSDNPQSFLPLNRGEIEPNRTVTCMALKATTNNRRHLALCHDEFGGPRSGFCRSGGICNNNNCPKQHEGYW
ncbi:uncharacterized protein TNCV_2939891 [Trichonephila clavipes]|nr:uncharacterized protein TNCV_2939891 [Trichonephila clavipes]